MRKILRLYSLSGAAALLLAAPAAAPQQPNWRPASSSLLARAGAVRYSRVLRRRPICTAHRLICRRRLSVHPVEFGNTRQNAPMRMNTSPETPIRQEIARHLGESDDFSDFFSRKVYSAPESLARCIDLA